MFLLEYKKGSFVDGEKIDWVELKGNDISFTVSGDTDNIFKVTLDCEHLFLNHLQALNDNITNIEKLKKTNP